MPEDKDYEALKRDYDGLKKKYDILQRNYEASTLESNTNAANVIQLKLMNERLLKIIENLSESLNHNK